MYTFAEEKYINVIGVMKLKHIIDTEYNLVKQDDNSIYRFLEKCFITLGTIKAGEVDYHNYVGRAYRIIKRRLEEHHCVHPKVFLYIVMAVSICDTDDLEK